MGDKALAKNILVLTADGRAGSSIFDPLRAAGMNVSVTSDLASALQRLADQQLLILDARDESTLALLCRQINDETGSRHPPILAVAHSHDVEARVRLLESGADDVIGLPVDERELEALADALTLRAPAPSETDESDAGGAAASGAKPAGPGRVIAFAAAKGGSGTTTLAVNTALILAEAAPGSVAIADMDMYHGQVSTHLDIYARDSTVQMAREDRATQTPEVVRDVGRQHASGLMVFGGPYRPDEGMDVTSLQLASLVELLGSVYGTVIVDVGSMIDARSLSVLAKADQIVMPITPDIPSLRLLHAALQVMSETASLTDKAMFVLNQMYPRPTIQAEQIEEHLGVKIALEVPYDGENFLRGVNEGQPLVLLARRSPAASAIKRLAEVAAETKLEDVAAAEPAPRGRFRQMLGRS